MKNIFFTMNDFSKEGGGTIRMLGLMNDLAILGKEVIFISNCPKSKYILFEKNITHINLNFPFTGKQKRIFQAILSFFPVFIVKLFFSKLFKKLNKTLQPFKNEEIIFFEYLDNSIGYIAKKENWVKGYVNDIHGVATEEFWFQYSNTKSLKKRIIFKAKYFSSKLLDKKVFENARGIIFSSYAMQDYFDKHYNLKNVKKYVVPNLISSNAINNTVDDILLKKIKEKYQIDKDKEVILFAGGFKQTGGITDLILAFEKVVKNNKKAILILIGDGTYMQQCKDLVSKLNLKEVVYFLGRIPYNQLRTYQEIADVIVCPDKQNPFSDMILHLKYLDALISGKIVINGSFKSVQEINKDEFLSINFIPSNVESLANSISFVLDNKIMLEEKYKSSKKYTAENLTYSQFVSVLEK